MGNFKDILKISAYYKAYHREIMSSKAGDRLYKLKILLDVAACFDGFEDIFVGFCDFDECENRNKLSERAKNKLTKCILYEIDAIF